jgi:alcohol dehydrogenase class IV
VTPTVLRLTPLRDAEAARLATALGVWKWSMSGEAAIAATTDALESFYRSLGMPTRIRDLDISEEDLPSLARDTRKNFNASSGVRTAAYVDEMLQLLKAAW